MKEYFEITARDLSALLPYFKNGVSRACDYTPGCCYLWSDYFSYRYRISEGFLIVKGVSKGKPFYLYPSGTGNFDKVMEELKEETFGNNLPLIFGVVPKEKISELSRYASNCAVLSERDWCDYVYLAEDLATLSGKKYHGQKNHLNFFNKTYQPEFAEITTDNVSRAVRFLEHLESVQNEREEELRYEKAHILKLLNHWDEVGQLGAMLLSEGKIVAFSVGEIKNDTLFVHVEKADRQYRGAYTAMMNAFVKFALEKEPTLKFVNREDDMGMEGLRKAKTDLHPAELIEKPNVILSENSEFLPVWRKLSDVCEIDPESKLS